jgi:hypothetical protein
MKLKSLLLVIAFISAATLGAHAQGAKQSPKSTATGKVGDATVTITYSSPSVKGRKIWGDLVPYDKVWRSGANEATILETDKEIKIGDKKIPAGKYSLYTLPGEKEWQVIINSQTGQWGVQRSGETTRNPENDVAVVKVKPTHSDTMQESLVYLVNQKEIVLKWENVEVAVPVK